MELSEQIKSARKAKELTQQELATQTKTDLRTIQHIESGQVSPGHLP